MIEKRFIREGYSTIVGVDEAGRGALFGPVVASAVVMPLSTIHKDLSEGIGEIDDSKVLTPKKRKRLAGIILKEARYVGVGLATNFEIDQENIYWASLKAMKRAIKSLSVRPDVLLIDGFRIKDVNCPQMCIPGGDRKSISIAAASIVAKVVRDKMMVLLDRVYEGYALGRNKGYGTEEHYRALKERGPTPLHRFSFSLEH
ncbi:MAG: ribonuclease HII [Candidatus Aminicenantes bacterium]|nr:ribonuclease HII [Candidatus Aminicenantes bacterium]